MRRIVSIAVLLLFIDAHAALAFPGPGSQYFVKEDLGKLPGDTRSSAWAINSSRQIVGDSGFFTAFIWTPPGPLVEIEPGTELRSGTDISDAGQIAGDAFGLVQFYDAFRWTPPGPAEGLPGPPEIIFDEYASAINESAVVVGSWEAPPLRPCIWYPGAPDGEDLGTLGGQGGWAADINESGAVVGSAEITGNSESHAFYWTQGGGMIDLGDGGFGSSGSEARGINDTGQIVGEVRYGATTSHVAYWPGPGQPIVDLGVIGGTSGRAYDISPGGTIVGRTTIGAGSERRAFRKRPSASMTQLGTLGGVGSEAHGISSAGHIVGEAGLANGETHAVVWWLYTVPYSYSCQCQTVPPPWPPGFFPVYVSSTVNLDARTVDPKTLTLGDSEDDDVHVARDPFTGEPLARLVDVTGDGNLDLLVQFDEEELRRAGEWTPETNEFWIQGATYDRSSGVEGIVQIDPTGIPGTPDATGAVSVVALRGPSPNPVTRDATLMFELPRNGDVTLAIYDTSGRLVTTLASGPHGAGRHVASWDRRDAEGRIVSPGVYIARLRASGKGDAAKIIVFD